MKKVHPMTEKHEAVFFTRPRAQVVANVTEEEAKALDSINVTHPVVYLDWLHEHPEDFQKLLPELNDIMEEVKRDPVKVTFKKHVSYCTQGWAILNVLADKYDTSLSKVGRGLIIYAIRHAKKGDE